MIEKAIGFTAAAGVWTAALVAGPPVLAFGIGVAIVTRPTMRRFAEQLEDDLERRDAVTIDEPEATVAA